MKRSEVAKLMDKIPQGLSPDDFLVALATHAAAWGMQQNSNRKWVGLTYDEINELSLNQEAAHFGFAKAVEQKLKEKNT